ncbi:uncharacterized protein LOC131152167 [Malania oleifera]|uniref:uncharacterized protein LOC131152167 n=1 Tax=Malania oleifera TaxID=397392 RepID=UPI0025ADAEB5|nr:uncharacterized protein LOC131152167 [Malania oleifera]
MEQGVLCRSRKNRVPSCQRLGAIALALLAIVSPLFIDRRAVSEEEVDEVQPVNVASWLPLLLLLLILAIALSGYLDQSLASFDPNWIHRFGGSSVGILTILIVLALVLKFKAYLMSWDC